MELLVVRIGSDNTAELSPVLGQLGSNILDTPPSGSSVFSMELRLFVAFLSGVISAELAKELMKRGLEDIQLNS